MIATHDNSFTRGVALGRFGGWFYLHVYYGIPGRSDFRWHIYLQILYPRWCPMWVIKRIPPQSHRSSTTGDSK